MQNLIKRNFIVCNEAREEGYPNEKIRKHKFQANEAEEKGYQNEKIGKHKFQATLQAILLLRFTRTKALQVLY